jgi:uncharacterized repeat protein (TIGR03833 family)
LRFIPQNFRYDKYSVFFGILRALILNFLLCRPKLLFTNASEDIKGRKRTGGVMEGKNRDSIKPGIKVDIVLKKDQRTGALTTGVVKRVLTKSPNHPHGIKVELESGDVGRVKKIWGRP